MIYHDILYRKFFRVCKPTDIWGALPCAYGFRYGTLINRPVVFGIKVNWACSLVGIQPQSHERSWGTIVNLVTQWLWVRVQTQVITVVKVETWLTYECSSLTHCSVDFNRSPILFWVISILSYLIPYDCNILELIDIPVKVMMDTRHIREVQTLQRSFWR